MPSIPCIPLHFQKQYVSTAPQDAAEDAVLDTFHSGIGPDTWGNYYIIIIIAHTHEHTPGVPPLHDVQVNHGLVERHSALYDFTTSFNHYVHEILVAFGPCPSLRLSPKSIWGDIFRHDSTQKLPAFTYIGHASS